MNAVEGVDAALAVRRAGVMSGRSSPTTTRRRASASRATAGCARHPRTGQVSRAASGQRRPADRVDQRGADRERCTATTGSVRASGSTPVSTGVATCSDRRGHPPRSSSPAEDVAAIRRSRIAVRDTIRSRLVTRRDSESHPRSESWLTRSAPSRRARLRAAASGAFGEQHREARPRRASARPARRALSYLLPGLSPDHDEVGLLRHRAGDLAAALLDRLGRPRRG